jgi:lysyl-tRNA synthetase, class II
MYEQDRLQDVASLRAIGHDPYEMPTWPLLAEYPIQNIIDTRAFAEIAESVAEPHPYRPVTVAGRVTLYRLMGKLCFATISDDTGTIQIGVSQKNFLGDWNLIKTIGLADHVVVHGTPGRTKTGELTIWATELSIVSKALLSPPSKLEGLQDVELRQRNRHVDLWNAEVMRTMQLRSEIISAIREFMRGRDFTEVETPVLQSLAGGATAQPFQTHHKTLGIDMFLRIAPELFLKRCLIGGMRRVFEIGKNFRNEGISTRHNPEFTAIEGYQAYSDHHGMMDLLEEMISDISQEYPPGDFLHGVHLQPSLASCELH